MALILLFGGMALLILGAELLVRGASTLALLLRISPLVIGLTVVSMGTSSPEVAVSVKAALSGNADIALGNVIGSNICNVLLILGGSALIIPLRISAQLIHFDAPIMIGLSLLLYVLSLDLRVGRLEGLFLVIGLILYTLFSLIQSKEGGQRGKGIYKKEFVAKGRKLTKTLLNIGMVLFGLALLTLGSKWFVGGAVGIARRLGVGELVVGLTIVAVGTSLPELVTSLVAAIKKERDIAVGNVVGSNIFNILGVLGFSSLVSADGIAVSRHVLGFDLPVMIAVALVCLPFFFTGHAISRLEGSVFLAYYGIYTSYLYLDAAGHSVLPKFSMVILYFVIPCTVATIVFLVIQELRRRKNTKKQKNN